MKTIGHILARYTAWILYLLVPLGIWGAFAIAFADSALLGMPVDAIVAFYVYQDHRRLLFYVVLASLGSALGSVPLYVIGYLGGEKVIPGYNIMGICKSALESSVEYLANELGPSGFRINALSAGPLKTLSSSAVGEFDQMLKLYTSFSPLRRNITAEEVANTGAYLLSDLASGVTGETMHVDAGYHIMGAPPSEMHGKL